MMKLYAKPALVALLCFFAAASCRSETKPATPLETLKAYTQAIKKKDTTTMKLLLSKDTIKMHDQEAKAQGVTLDDVVKRETLFLPDQKVVEYRNEKIDGERATVEMKNQYGSFDTVYFVKEEDGWKIDKQGFADKTIQENDLDNNALDNLINTGKEP